MSANYRSEQAVRQELKALADDLGTVLFEHPKDKNVLLFLVAGNHDDGKGKDSAMLAVDVHINKCRAKDEHEWVFYKTGVSLTIGGMISALDFCRAHGIPDTQMANWTEPESVEIGGGKTIRDHLV